MLPRKFIIVALVVLGIVYGWYNFFPQSAENVVVKNEKLPPSRKINNILIEPNAEDVFPYIPNFKMDIIDKNLLFQQLESDEEITMEDE